MYCSEVINQAGSLLFPLPLREGVGGGVDVAKNSKIPQRVKPLLTGALPKHRIIYNQLQTEIAAGKYSAGVRLPSESQLVRHFRVSRPTAARALRDLQSAGLIERRAGVGSFAGHATPSTTDVRLLGLLIPGLGTTEIFEPICGEIASLARVHEYSVLWGGSMQPWRDTDASVDHMDQVCTQFIERGVAGVFFAPFELTSHRNDANRRISERLRKAGIPMLLLDRDVTVFPARSDFDLVSIDNVAGGFILAQHLLKLGCKRLGFLARPESAPTIDARITGYREALARNKMDSPRDTVLIGDAADVRFARSLVTTSRLDGVICGNDHTAALLMRSLEHAGIKVPREIRVAGFDDVKYAALLTVPLTTIHQPCRDIGEVAFRGMLERIAHPTLTARTMLLAPTLVVRESCGAYIGRAAT